MTPPLFQCWDCHTLAPWQATCSCGGGVFSPEHDLTGAVLCLVTQGSPRLIAATLAPLRTGHPRRRPANLDAEQIMFLRHRADTSRAETQALLADAYAAIERSRQLLERLP